LYYHGCKDGRGSPKEENMKVTISEKQKLGKVLVILNAKKEATQRKISAVEVRVAEKPFIKKAREVMEGLSEIIKSTDRGATMSHKGFEVFKSEVGLTDPFGYMDIDRACYIQDVLDDALKDIEEEESEIKNLKREFEEISKSIEGIETIVSSAKVVPNAIETEPTC
jgi:hypothetical protein